MGAVWAEGYRHQPTSVAVCLLRAVRRFIPRFRWYVLHAADMSSPARPPVETMCLALRMKDGKFSLRTLDVTVADRVGMSTQQLLLEAFTRMDEEDAAKRP
jgi:hypothetical protein